MAIQWNQEKMTTCFPEIDAQHQEWIRCFNDFDRLVVEDRALESIAAALECLVGYTESHFATEEKLMERFNLPVRAANIAAHEQFRARLAEINAWLSAFGASSVELVDLKTTMEDWLVNHICTIDVQLRNVAPKSGF